MFKIILLVSMVLAVCRVNAATRTVNSHLSGNDMARLQKVFGEGINSNDLQSIYYSALHYNTVAAGEKQAVCKKLLEVYAESKYNDFEKNFYLVATIKHLACDIKAPPTVLNSISTAFDKDDVSTAQEIFFNLFSSKALGIQIGADTVNKLSKNLQNILKKDDSLSSLGYGFYISSELGAPGSFVVDRIEDAIVQSDEVDGKMLQFEGGLSITALIINGAFKATKAHNKPSPITEEQAVKFATYFLTRRSVQTPKGAHVLIEALKTLSSQKNISPICVQVTGNGQLQYESPTLSITVVDLLGASVVPDISSISGKVINKKGNAVLAEKVQFVSKSSDKTVYAADLSTFKPSRGLYSIDIKADTYTQTLTFKVLGRVKVHSLELGVGDADSASALKKRTISHPSKLSEELNADHSQKVVLKFVLTDEATNKVISVHQAFVRFLNKETDEEIIFVAEQDTTNAYKFDMDVGARGVEFGHKSGLYELELIVGDASLSNSFQWHLADITLKFPHEPKKDTTSGQKRRQPLPEIVHKFREPEKLPARFVSDLFTVLCFTPLILLLVLWIKLGINISNFTFNLSTLGFHLGLGSIMGLFAVFWLQLNMFETIRYLIPLAIFTFLCGNRLLRSLAAQKPAT